MRSLSILLVMLLFPVALLGAQPDLWFYYSANLLPEENLKTLEQVWRKAAAAGYSKVLLADYKLAILDRLESNTTRYMEHLARVRKLADELRLEIVPAVFPVGYSNALLANDPNLAEGLPVRNALFVVQGGEAHLVADPRVALNAKPDWADSSYAFANGVATTPGHKGNARMVWKVNLTPFRCYHIAVKVKTSNYTGEPEIKPLVGGKTALSFTSLGVKRTQDWTEHHIVFDSLDNQAISIYMGVWGDATGQLQWKDWKIEEVGLLNVLRRPGAPCVVEGYTEGKDYQPISDPRLGVVPWPGDYETWHTPPVIKTSMPDGTRLRVSWYFTVIIQGDQVMCCPSEPKTRELLANEAKTVREALHPRGMMMSHDEIRLLNWDESCQRRKETPGEIIASNVAFCTGLLRNEQAYVWSDMFDPYHNATDNYYLVNGTLAESWKGLDKRVTIMNWNFDNRVKSLRFFADRGHAQVVAAYYDAPLEHTRLWLEGTKGVRNITGVMYTTWQNNYSDLEGFAKLVRTSIPQ